MSFFTVRSIVTAAVLAAATAAVQAQTVRYVDDDAPPGGDGTTWATAYRFLQDALACAADPDCPVTEIRVAGGLYRPDRDEANPEGTGNRQASFALVGDAVVRGGHLGLAAGAGESPDARDPSGHPSILSGDLAGDDGPGFAGNDENSYHVLTALGGAGQPTLDGLTITAGHADGATPRDRGGGLYVDGSDVQVLGCTFVGNAAGGPFGNGGGAYLLTGDPFFADCTFAGNLASVDGGGLYVAPVSRPLVAGCTFDGNVAAGRGGAVRSNASDPVLVNCLFVANVAIEGGALHNTGPSHPVVADCVFAANAADTRGGAMYNAAAASPDVVNCTFVGNAAGTEGGGMRNLSSHPLVTGCAFEGNQAQRGGGMANWVSSPALTACTFTDNTADDGGGLANVGQSTPLVESCTFTANTAPGGAGGGVHNEACSPQVSHCVFIDNDASDGGAMANDQVSSPLVDGCSFIANTAEHLGGAVFSRYGGAAVVTGCTFTDNTAGIAGGGLASVLYSVPELADTLLCANVPDPLDGPWVDHGGNQISDTCAETCPDDVTRDGRVDVTDVLVVVVEWGPCAAGCVGDVDADGEVGVTDLLSVLGAWGPCPSPARGPGMPGRATRRSSRAVRP